MADPLSKGSRNLRAQRRRTVIAYAGAASVGALAAFLHASLPWVLIVTASYVFLMLPWIFIGKSFVTLWKERPR